MIKLINYRIGLIKEAIIKYRKAVPIEELDCPVCGYYCLGKGGVGCGLDSGNSIY